MKKNERAPQLFVKNDFRLLLLLLLLIILLFLVRDLLRGHGGLSVTVTQDGKKTAEYRLTETKEVVLPAPNGGSNTLHIENGHAWVTGSTCPDKLCERQGKISREGEMIVCLPNRLTVSVTE